MDAECSRDKTKSKGEQRPVKAQRKSRGVTA